MSSGINTDESTSEVIERIEATLAQLKEMKLEDAENREDILDCLQDVDDGLVDAFDVACGGDR
jgi:hypothetical protein